MIPEELNRTIEFIIQSQARLAAAQEQDREERIEFEKWSKNITRQLAAADQRIAELIEIESGRLDRHDQVLDRHDQALDRHDQAFERHDRDMRAAQERFDATMMEMRKEREEARRRHEEAMARLDRIFERLIDRRN